MFRGMFRNIVSRLQERIKSKTRDDLDYATLASLLLA